MAWHKPSRQSCTWNRKRLIKKFRFVASARQPPPETNSVPAYMHRNLTTWSRIVQFSGERERERERVENAISFCSTPKTVLVSWDRQVQGDQILTKNPQHVTYITYMLQLTHLVTLSVGFSCCVTPPHCIPVYTAETFLQKNSTIRLLVVRFLCQQVGVCSRKARKGRKYIEKCGKSHIYVIEFGEMAWVHTYFT
jgi:hypothetical protein